MNKPLVTVLTPCYNGEYYVQRFLDSILSQTYKNIEFIIVNDGSTDNTEKIIKSNEEKFIKKGYTFKYLYQENQGQAAAINNGLKYVTGEYLTWPDSDDILTPESIEKKVKFLEKNKDYGLVRTNVNAVKENTINKIEYIIKPKNQNKYIFDDIIFENTYCTNGAYLLRMKSFLKVNPKREIYVSNGGQNWQMLLPICFDYKCGYIDQGLYTYVVRENSHSHIGSNNFDKELERLEGYKDILLNTIKKINLDQKKYEKLINTKYHRREMMLGLKFKNRKFAQERYKKLKQNKELMLVDKIYYVFGINIISKILIKIYNLIFQNG